MDQSTLSLSDETLAGVPVSLTNCDREPIHIPGLIQPYGFLLCLDQRTRLIVQASANTTALLGRAPETLLGQGLDQLLSADRVGEIEALWDTLTTTARLLGGRLAGVPGQPFYKLILHRHDELVWVEGEPVADVGAGALDLPQLHTTLSQMMEASSVLEFCQQAVNQVREITGFDRVAMYRFGGDESGEVVAEAIRADLAPWLGLRYPASDIPQQARALYLKNWLRFIPDVAYAPVPLVPTRNPATARPPDMTYAVLRSVSPIHLEYLRNLGSAATMTISVIRDEKLWGMITCHHLTPRLVSYELRDLCQFIGKTFSALLKGKEQQDESAYRLRILETQARLFEQVSSEANFVEGLYQHPFTLLDVFDCGGAAVCVADDIILLGNTPNQLQTRELLAWLRANMTTDLFATDSYVRHNPAGLVIRGTASGLLVVRLAQDPGDYLLWFRPEQVQTVTWAGQTQKVEVLADGQLFLSPRQSFEAWKELVENTAAPWKPLELEAANNIRLHLAAVRLKLFNELQARAATLSRLNTELARSNDELDSFSYVASHDLKEPLRGIHNYSIFLLEDYADQLDADGVSKLQTLVRLSQRMESLIESLLQISRVGRLELDEKPTDLNQVVADVLELLAPRLEQMQTSVVVAEPLPLAVCDPVRMQEVFNNLFTNAMRYNDKPVRHVTVGVAPASLATPRGNTAADFHILYVRDNGIGIDPRHHETIFRIFKRLHSPDKYGGGTGAGLAIVKKMIDKHGGELWIDSALGAGTTFYFSLPKQP